MQHWRSLQVWHTGAVHPPVLRDHYSTAEFRSLIDRESDRIELKTGAGGKPLQEALVAFSNTDGA